MGKGKVKGNTRMRTPVIRICCEEGREACGRKDIRMNAMRTLVVRIYYEEDKERHVGERRLG